MSIATTVRTAGPFAGTGSLVALPFAFKVFAASDLVVQRTNVAGDVATLTLTTHYSVSLNADQDTSPGGTVTLVTALAVGETAALTSSVSATQPLQLASGGPFLPGQIEDALDRAMIVVQQQGVLGEQALRVPLGETALILPSADQRANKALLFDADGDPYLAAPASGSAADLALSIASTAAGDGAALVGSNDAGGYFDGATAEAQLQDLGRSRTLLEVYADLATDGSDITTALNIYYSAAKVLGVRLRLPSAGTYNFSDTLTFDGAVEIIGGTRDKCVLNFNNAIPLKPAIVFRRGAGKCRVSGFTLTDQTFGTSRGIELRDTSSDPGAPLWKLTFERVEVVGFAQGHAYTTNVPLNGATQVHCSETLWLQCRFVINVLTCLNQNSQAVNNTYLRCDFENFDTTYHGSAVVDASWEFFRDEAGGGVVVNGGSLIGRGAWFTWKYPASGVSLFSGAQFKMSDIRVEARSVHGGVCIKEDIHGVTGSLGLDIVLRDITVVAYGQNIDLMQYGGRVDVLIDNVNTVQGTGTLTVRQYPTSGRTSGATTASQGIVKVRNSSVLVEKETSSPYGTYAANSTGQVLVDWSTTSSTNSSMLTDAQGFFGLSGPGAAQQFGMQINNAPAPARLVWNNDSTGSGAASDVKVLLPKGARPLKLIAYKHPQQFAANVGWLLYLVKDNANWANPASFAVGTDAYLVASMPSTLNASGYYEVPCVLLTNGLGNELRAGFGSWAEGRMLFQKVGGATPFTGWFGVEYI